jgi:hypothetical protein
MVGAKLLEQAICVVRIKTGGTPKRICGFIDENGGGSAALSAFMSFLRGQNVVCFDKNLMFFKDSYDSFHSMCAVKVNTSLPLFFLTSAQIRAARSLIRWTAEDLASASALSVATIRRAELKKNQTALTSANDLAIRRALESAGVEFIDENGGGPGVRLRKRQQKTGSRRE